MPNIVLRESFDNYPAMTGDGGVTTAWTYEDGATGFSLGTGRKGVGQSLYHSNNALIKGFSVAVTEGVVGFACRPTELNNPYRWWMRLLDSSGTFHMGLNINADGSIGLYRMTNERSGTLLGITDPGLIAINNWYHIGLGFVHHDTTGEMHLYLNGNSTAILDVTGVDTKNGGLSSISAIAIGGPLSSSSKGGYDDIYVTDDVNDYLGDLCIELYRANADGAHLDFVPSTGSTHYGVVDETLASTTDYLTGSSVGEYDEIGFEDLTSTPTNIYEANVLALIKKTDAGTRAMTLGIDSNSTIDEGDNHYLETSVTYHRQVNPLDPDGSVAWTKTKVNAVIGRPKIAV